MSFQRGLQQVEQRYDAAGQKEGRGDQHSGLVSRLLSTRVSKQIYSKNQGDRTPGKDKSPERPQRSSAPQQYVMAAAASAAAGEGLVHGSVLWGMGRNRKWLFLAKELKVGNERLHIVFLHDAATRTARVLSVDFSGGPYRYFTTAIRIGAMPELPRFHDHGCAPLSAPHARSLPWEKTSRWDDARLTEK
jgi:hypothetical protein